MRYLYWLPLLFVCSVWSIGLSTLDDLVETEANANSQAHYFDQLIDHTNATWTFKQRYYVNATFFKQGGPIFLYIGGEGELNGISIDTGFVNRLAREFGGLVVGVEHRYYGKSQPFEELTFDHLAYLKSELGLKDLSRFIKEFKWEQLDLSKSKWITVGGSYPGNLSAWMRKFYPDQIFAALASSAPLVAKSDFTEYDLMVQKALGAECSDRVRELIVKLDSLYSHRDSSAIADYKRRFSCEGISDDLIFLNAISDALAGVIQYNRPTREPSIPRLCDGLKLDQFEQNVDHIANITKWTFKNENQTCVEFSGLEQLKSPKIVPDEAIRQWTYQSCREFGYWQTAPHYPNNRLRSQFQTEEFSWDFFCGQPFFDQEIGFPSVVDKTNHFYGGKDIHTDRIIFTNGEFDPWSTLSVTESDLAGLDSVAIVIPGGSHTQDLGSDNPKDTEELRKVRQQIIDTFKKWLNQ